MTNKNIKIEIDPEDVILVLDHYDNPISWPTKVWDARMRLAVAAFDAVKEKKDG